MIEFDKNECNSIKSIVIKGNTTTDIKTLTVWIIKIRFSIRLDIEIDISISITVRYCLTQKIEPCTNEDEIRLDVTAQKSNEIYALKENMRLDLDILNFEKPCFQINHILNKNNFFLRVFELKEKFCCLIKQNAKRKNVIRELPLCIFAKCNSLQTCQKRDTRYQMFFSTRNSMAYRNYVRRKWKN